MSRRPADRCDVAVVGASLGGTAASAIQRIEAARPELVCAVGGLEDGADEASDRRLREAVGADVPILRSARDAPFARSASGIQAVGDAVRHLRAGEARRALVVAAARSFGAAVVLLERRD